MLEIIFIVILAKKLAGIAEAKGRSKGWAALGPVLWIVGEISGAAAAVLMGLDELALYGGALVGAAIGAGIAWAVVNGLSAHEAYAGLEGAVDDRVVGGNYDPTNPYNAPGAARGVDPYTAAPPHNNPRGPFDR